MYENPEYTNIYRKKILKQTLSPKVDTKNPKKNFLKFAKRRKHSTTNELIKPLLLQIHISASVFCVECVFYVCYRKSVCPVRSVPHVVKLVIEDNEFSSSCYPN